MPAIGIFSDDGVVPRYMSAGAAGMDVYAAIPTRVYIFPQHTVFIPTGLRIVIPAEYEVQVRPRSGFSSKNGIMFPNSPGTIDRDYRGQIYIPIRNIAATICIIRPRDRIAQLVCARAPRIRWRRQRSHGSMTARGAGGFGSTGH